MSTYRINTPEGLQAFLNRCPEMDGFKFLHAQGVEILGEDRGFERPISPEKVSWVTMDGTVKTLEENAEGVLPSAKEFAPGKGLLVVEDGFNQIVRIWDFRR